MKSIREKLLKRELCIGTWIQNGHPGIAEQLADCGFEWLCADMEHTDIDVHTYAQLARAISGKNAAPLARVLKNDVYEIRSVLDNGASGVIVPLVETAEEARKAVSAAKYPPEGVRGFAFCLANRWGECLDEYAAEANAGVSVVVMAETRKAIENIDEIAAVEGVDGILIGPYDLSGFYGVLGQTAHPLVCDASRRVVEACEAHGKSPGFHLVTPTVQEIQRIVSSGFRFIALGMDNVFMMNAAKEALAALDKCIK